MPFNNNKIPKCIIKGVQRFIEHEMHLRSSQEEHIKYNINFFKNQTLIVIFLSYTHQKSFTILKLQ
jgi:hypothetical protein